MSFYFLEDDGNTTLLYSQVTDTTTVKLGYNELGYNELPVITNIKS